MVARIKTGRGAFSSKAQHQRDSMFQASVYRYLFSPYVGKLVSSISSSPNESAKVITSSGNNVRCEIGGPCLRGQRAARRVQRALRVRGPRGRLRGVPRLPHAQHCGRHEGKAERGIRFSVGATRHAQALETGCLFIQGSSPGQSFGKSFCGTFGISCLDWSNGLRYHTLDTTPYTE
jgi:hypothetical protein